VGGERGVVSTANGARELRNVKKGFEKFPCLRGSNSPSIDCERKRNRREEEKLVAEKKGKERNGKPFNLKKRKPLAAGQIFQKSRP